MATYRTRYAYSGYGMGGFLTGVFFFLSMFFGLLPILGPFIFGLLLGPQLPQAGYTSRMASWVFLGFIMGSSLVTLPWGYKITIISMAVTTITFWSAYLIAKRRMDASHAH